jgi:hypothetical protein
MAAIAFARPEIGTAELADRSGIATNLARHGRGVDRNDRTLLLSAYHADATVAYGLYEGPAADFVDFLIAGMAGEPVTLHRTSNMLVQIEAEQARSESYVIAYMRTPDGGAGTQRLIGGRYLDRHEKRDGRWRIAHRVYVLDWNINVPSREVAGMAAGAARGMQGAGDPSVGHFAGSGRKEAMMQDDVADALARQALHDLVAIFARATDRADPDLMLSAMHPDAEIITGVVDGVGVEFARGLTDVVRAHLRSCFHSVGNEYFEIDGDRAAGETYVLAHSLSADDDPQETLTGGRYLDRFERRGGVWKIASRRFVQDWSMTQSATREDTGLYEQLPTRGGFAPNDPSIAFWAQR